MAELGNMVAVAMSYLIGACGSIASYSKFQENLSTSGYSLYVLSLASVGMLALGTAILIRCAVIDRKSTKNASE